MLRFVVRRLVLLIPILLGLSLLIFVWVRALPGTPADALLGERRLPQNAAARAVERSPIWVVALPFAVGTPVPGRPSPKLPNLNREVFLGVVHGRQLWLDSAEPRRA